MADVAARRGVVRFGRARKSKFEKMNKPKEVYCIQCPGAFIMWPSDPQYGTHIEGTRLLCGTCIAKGMCDECNKKAHDMVLCDGDECTAMVCPRCDPAAAKSDLWYCEHCMANSQQPSQAKRRRKKEKEEGDQIDLLQARILETVGINIQSINGLANLALYADQLSTLFKARGDLTSDWSKNVK
jgi:hypothetical protein